MNTKEVGKRAKETQIAKYGGLAGYRAEMRRRRSLVKKKGGFATMSKEKIRAAQLKGAKTKAEQRAKYENLTPQTEDSAQSDD